MNHVEIELSKMNKKVFDTVFKIIIKKYIT